MKLAADSVSWAINSLLRCGDTDLFPKLIELDAIQADLASSIKTICDIDIESFKPSSTRRFIVPKDGLSYRAATQLDPLDSIILTALVHQFGQGIEKRRQPIATKRVFSYRFNPSVDGELYVDNSAWNKFWTHCKKISNKHSAILVVDISDFYNQINHETMRDQLVESGWPSTAIQWVNNLFSAVTATSARGIPVGPHASHILAESTLIPVDNSLLSRGLKFCRFVDDIVIFTENKIDARVALYNIAEVLDKQQRLHLQKNKTKILDPQEFQEICDDMIEDRPINSLEKSMVDIIKKYTGSNPYAHLRISDISEEDLRAFSENAVCEVLDEYLDSENINYPHLRWFLRRLAQVGHPAAVGYCLRRFEELIPAISDVCRYFVSVSAGGEDIDWEDLGSKLLAIFENPLVEANEYFQLSVLALFNKEPELNHVDQLVHRFSGGAPHIRREIILACSAAKAVDWLRERKEEFQAMDPWTRRAFLYSAKILPVNERRQYLNSIVTNGILEEIIARWAQK